jgi:hypothetical protein
MISELEIYRSANILIKQHSEHAAIHAVMMADELLGSGDVAAETARAATIRL